MDFIDEEKKIAVKAGKFGFSFAKTGTVADFVSRDWFFDDLSPLLALTFVQTEGLIYVF